MIYKTPPEKMLKEMSQEWFDRVLNYFDDDNQAMTDAEIEAGFLRMNDG